MMSFLLDCRLRGTVRRFGLPDIPEVRRFTRACYWNGFTFGALEASLPALKREALAAAVRFEAAQDGRDA